MRTRKRSMAFADLVYHFANAFGVTQIHMSRAVRAGAHTSTRSTLAATSALPEAAHCALHTPQTHLSDQQTSCTTSDVQTTFDLFDLALSSAWPATSTTNKVSFYPLEPALALTRYWCPGQSVFFILTFLVFLLVPSTYFTLKNDEGELVTSL